MSDDKKIEDNQSQSSKLKVEKAPKIKLVKVTAIQKGKTDTVLYGAKFIAGKDGVLTAEMQPTEAKAWAKAGKVTIND